MRVIYLDSLFLLNLLLDYLLLLLTGKVAGAPLERWKIALGAVLGATYAALAVYPGHPVLLHPLVKIGVGVLMALIAYGGVRGLLRLTVVFFALSAALGGGLYALSFLGFGLDAIHGIPTPTLDLKVVLLAALAAYCLLSLFGRKLARHGPREVKKLEIQIGERAVKLNALLDSGNTLQDPMTGKGVVVAEGAALQPLLPPEADYQNPAQAFPNLPDPRRFRLLPYRSVGVDTGLLLAVKADSIRVGLKSLGPRLVALSPTPVSEVGDYQALFFEE